MVFNYWTRCLIWRPNIIIVCMMPMLLSSPELPHKYKRSRTGGRERDWKISLFAESLKESLSEGEFHKIGLRPNEVEAAYRNLNLKN